ncbi:MAG TPA: gamma-glutamyltransferase [Candidatus Binatia bacterium]|nr:gamma-glutamyltransferase [Candidatus Binatia bacterium]
MADFARHAVCSPLTLASETGRDVLRSGGNAVDAAIATNLVLAVAYPHMCGVGGDLLAMVWDGDALVGLNSSGRLPAAATLPPDGVPERGIGSATVPGAPAGWRALAERFGTRSLRTLAEPAIRLAREGVERAPGLARMTEWSRGLLAADGAAAAVFLAGGALRQPDLAETLAALDDFYIGPVARHAPAPFAPDDFAAHRPEWVTPQHARFAGMEIYEMPPNSRGHLALEALARVEPLDGLAPDDPEFHLRLIRALRPVRPGGDTIYMCAVDERGMAVSLNQSLYMAFGSGVVVPGTGVLLHNRGAYHTPATYRGGARPVHTLAPAMALAGGRPALVFGTMGGEGQTQIHLQLLARILVAGESVERAVAAPRWIVSQDTLLVEDGLPSLAPPGMTLVRMPVADLAGHAHAIRLRRDRLEAAADPRADGVAVGD